jgi:hypothetical protein
VFLICDTEGKEFSVVFENFLFEGFGMRRKYGGDTVRVWSHFYFIRFGIMSVPSLPSREAKQK